MTLHCEVLFGTMQALDISLKGKLHDISTQTLILDIFGSKLLLRTINNQNRFSIELNAITGNSKMAIQCILTGS